MTNNPSWNRGDSLPVDSVTWEEANEFCRRLTRLESTAGRVPPGYAYRLPTEAEWESAARSSEFYSSWVPSGPLQDHAWFASNSGFHTHPVGTKSKNPWGLHDMAGNVGEWCRDWYGSYPASTVVDPKGPVSGLYRVVRGGSFIDGQTALRVAARNGGLPSQPSRFIGFRVVLGVALD
jgi:formylglycine-generating enzyme required for sulfatase activity